MKRFSKCYFFSQATVSKNSERASTSDGSVLGVRDRGSAQLGAEMRLGITTALSQNGKIAEMRAVQGVRALPTGAYLAVRDRGSAQHNTEMRRIYVIFH